MNALQGRAMEIRFLGSVRLSFNWPDSRQSVHEKRTTESEIA